MRQQPPHLCFGEQLLLLLEQLGGQLLARAETCACAHLLQHAGRQRGEEELVAEVHEAQELCAAPALPGKGLGKLAARTRKALPDLLQRLHGVEALEGEDGRSQSAAWRHRK
jgi:hypothetical protein